MLPRVGAAYRAAGSWSVSELVKLSIVTVRVGGSVRQCGSSTSELHLVGIWSLSYVRPISRQSSLRSYRRWLSSCCDVLVSGARRRWRPQPNRTSDDDKTTLTSR